MPTQGGAGHGKYKVDKVDKGVKHGEVSGWVTRQTERAR
jgi:hypothetical protein